MRASPRSYARFTELPPGAIQPDGWLRQYARINADGWLLRYAKMRDPELYSILWDRVASLEGYWDSSCDFAGYFADGLVRYAQLVPESDLATELDEWLSRLLDSQDPDGYLGPFEPDARNTQILEAFTIGILVEALLQRYEFTADPEILRAAERAMRALMKQWRPDGERSNVRSYLLHGTYVIRAATQIYKHTGKQDFLTYAREVLDRFGRVEHYLRFYPECEIRDQRRKRGWIAPAPEDQFAPPPHFRHQYDQTDFLGFSASSIADGYNACSGRHNVCESEDVGLPAILYEYSGDEELLRASEAAWTMMQAHLSPHGSPLGNELLHHRGPRASTEHCGAVEWMLTNQALTRITGAVKYADAAERAFFNAYPAAKSTDGQLIAYLHAANQLVASEWTFPPWNDPDKGWSSHFYSTAHDPLCCNANGPRAIPHFIGGMAMAEPGGLTVLQFGPCTITADLPDSGQVKLRQETDYPFEDFVRITVVQAPRDAFSFGIRIPGWSASARIAINGVRWDGVANPGAIARIARVWRPGDQVDVRFEAPIRLVVHPETALRVGGVAVQRGPLLYALPIAEDWQPYEAVHAWARGDPLSYQLLPRRSSRWRVALELDPDDPDSSFTLVNRQAPDDSSSWDIDHAPIGLRARVRTVRNWRLEGDRDHPDTPGLPYKPLDLSERTTTATLLPYGCTRLRLAYLPWVKSRPN